MIILQSQTVGDAYSLEVAPSLVVPHDAKLEDAIRAFTSRSERGGIFVVNSERRLMGMITHTDLLDWARVRLGALLQAPLPDAHKTIRLANLIDATTAGEVMRPNSGQAAVTVNDSLADALMLMIELDLIVVPVVDENSHIIGDLKMSEILARVIDAGERGADRGE